MQARSPSFDARGDTPGQSDDDGWSRGQTTLDFAVGMSIFLLAVAFVISFTPNLVQPFADSGTEDTVTANRVASQLVGGTLADPEQPYVLDRECTIAFFAPENADGDATDDDDLNDANDGQLERDRYDIGSDDDISTADCNFQLLYLHERLGVAGIDEDGNVDRAISPGLQIEIYGDVGGDGEHHLLCLDSNNDPAVTSDPDLDSEIIEATDNNPWDTNDDCDASSGDYDIPFQVGEDPPENTGSIVVSRRIVTIDGIRATVYVRVW